MEHFAFIFMYDQKDIYYFQVFSLRDWNLKWKNALWRHTYVVWPKVEKNMGISPEICKRLYDKQWNIKYGRK